MVAVQVALSAVLLAGAGLFIRSLHQLEAVDIGFRREGVLTMEIAPERAWFGTARWLERQDAILGQVSAIPGVRSASWATMNPMSGRDRGAMMEVPGFSPLRRAGPPDSPRAISPAYFDTLGVPILWGRDFDRGDREHSPKVAMINETAARFYFGESSAIGRRIRFTNYPQTDLIYEVVGVVKDMKHDTLREPVARFIYLPIPQSVDRINRLALAVRCSGDALAFAKPVSAQIESEGWAPLITNVTTIEKQVGQTLMRERLVVGLSTVFGAVALVLAAIGLYGILAYTVTRRTNELGIRMALGATWREIVWLVLREALVLAAAGLTIAVPLVLALGRVTSSLLFGVEAFDPLVFAGAIAILLAFTAIAATGPSRGASSLDPISALRRE
jgi:predicted permease